jgi:hypothetical protein
MAKKREKWLGTPKIGSPAYGSLKIDYIFLVQHFQIK